LARSRTRAGANPLQAIIDYLNGTRAELRRVSWPDREEATRLTVIVLVVTLVMSAILGLMDFVFAKLVGLVI
jgi:preprotein translocase subunit SecE